ncbi:MAG: hypothetical protein A3J30_02515 [Candidatus Wildermuthbacteria bacterium RIFCSPLOWO2_02_FULL_47_9c]|uniref:Uncharacterized protein n=3 Tax=Parcubacteria group TaxID=1794811 RepID=A0A0G1XES0_9BACT|nr:MAG: hypothetical protein UY25_C0002G0140 [Candidatus Yanofskybacteria bacterium GW2011_GWC1_48_11]KKW04611.1 MAG: hypothetical protein UY38_C0001G0178 [Parcubacteria group bacterium GW2011_GWB1_49_12]KKW09131.1 MAG: hypothetical protein UY45_C0001G0017 [Parcubacteria group bacterium GW2011_GWA1_49_26]KKW13598.1 MAG: hypothetical protein UY53_C0010G0007 [Parcubacteria group bacterium GW2011_GWA2_50_10]KKW29390.1 MAG: hypothetical protein UY74_C0077G0008 [Candidatus Kaiserbacteria bacterium G
MPPQLLEFLSRVNSPELQAKLLWIKLPFLVVVAFFIAVILIALLRTPYIRLSIVGDAVEIITFRPFGTPRIKRRWQKIMQRLDSGSESEYKLAIMEADTLLEEVLQKMRVSGSNVDERLQKVTQLMVPSIEELRAAHQARNSIVYDVDYRLGLQEARHILETYQKAFEELDLFR